MSHGDDTIRILLVEDHPLLRQGLAYVLDREPGFAVVGEAGSLEEAREVFGEVNVAIVDLGLPTGNGVKLIEELRGANPNAMVLVLTASLDREEFARAVEAGAAGVLNKVAGLDDIIGAVRRLCAGEMLLSVSEVIELTGIAAGRKERESSTRAAIERLTPREREVLETLTEGLGNEEISRRLGISVETERNYMRSIFAKLGVHSRLQALVFAMRHGLVDIRPEPLSPEGTIEGVSPTRSAEIAPAAQSDPQVTDV